jgi:hypothetical protein
MSFVGFGVRLYDYRPLGDGTVEATRWVTIAGLPLIPLETERIRPLATNGEHAGAPGGEERRHEVLGRRPTPLARALRVVLLSWVVMPAVIAGPPVAAFLVLHPEPGVPLPWWKAGVSLCAIGWAMGVVWWLRRRTSRHVGP